MDKRIFSELLESVAEMGRISRGEIQPSRVIETLDEPLDSLGRAPWLPPDRSATQG